MNRIENKGIYVIAASFILFVIAIVPVIGDNPPSSPSSISCNISSSTLSLGDEITVSGSISPIVSGVTVTLTYTNPNSTTLTRTTISQSDGSYQDVYAPDLIGSWSVKSSWFGNVDYLGSTSFAVGFEVRDSSAVFPLELTVGVIAIIIIATIAIYWFTKKNKPTNH